MRVDVGFLLVISPALTIRLTSVWSSVSWRSSPARSRYARLSPTCARCAPRSSTVGGRERRAHPRHLAVGHRAFEDGAVRGADQLGERSLPARGTAPRSCRAPGSTRPRRHVRRPCRRRRRRAAARPGTSPRCARGPGRCPWRRRRRPSSAELQHGRADSDLVARLDHGRRGELLVVHERAVRRAEVLDVPGAVLAEDARVLLRTRTCRRSAARTRARARSSCSARA